MYVCVWNIAVITDTIFFGSLLAAYSTITYYLVSMYMYLRSACGCYILADIIILTLLDCYRSFRDLDSLQQT